MPADRMIYRSCELCARSKTKCHDVNLNGCYRCRLKEKRCSLAGLDHATRPSHSPGQENFGSPMNPREPRDRVERLEARCRQLEQQLDTLSRGSRSGTDSGDINGNTLLNTQSSPVAANHGWYRLPYREMDAFSVVKAILQPPTSFVFNERVSSAIDAEGYPSAIKRELLTERQFIFAYTVAKERFAKLLPLPSLSAESAESHRSPTHPFVQLAFLMHVPGFLSPDIEHKLHLLVDESVLFSLSGAVDKNVVLALLILSLAPAPLSSDMHLPITPLRLISLAYGYGQDIGLGYYAERIEEPPNGPRVSIRHWRYSLGDRFGDDYLLMDLIERRYQILHIQFSGFKAGYASEHHFVDEKNRPMREPAGRSRHSYDEADICRASAEMVEFLALQEGRKNECWPDVQQCERQWQRYQDQVSVSSGEDIAYSSAGLIRLEKQACAFALAIRITCLFQPNIAVISLEAYTEVQQIVARIILWAGTTFVQEFMDSQLYPMPHHLTMHFVCAVMMLRRTHFLCQRMYPDLKVVDEELLEKAEKSMQDMKGLPAKCLDQLWYQLQVNESEALGYSMASGWVEQGDSDSARSGSAD